MDKTTIEIVNTVGSGYCIEAEDGNQTFELICQAFKADRMVVLSFLNVELLTTAFLNTAIGQLYRDFREDFIKSHLSVEALDRSGLVKLKRVVDTAKLYYRDPEAMQRSIDAISED